MLRNPSSAYLSHVSVGPSPRSKYLLFPLLFLVSVLVLSPGIGEITGVTAKDEYHVSLRVPLSMIEQDVWIVPVLQTVPEIRKPPMVYWLTRATFGIFGVSLTNARMVSVAFAALLVLAVALIGFELTESLRYSLFAGLIALSTLAISIQSKHVLLDVPTATFSAWAFYWFLKYCKIPRVVLLAGIALSLSGGFLTKGPVVLVVFGSGVLSLLITNRQVRSIIWRQKVALSGTLLLFLGLSASWFVYAYLVFSDYSVEILQQEMTARNIGMTENLSLLPVIGAAVIAFPWTFLLMDLIIRPKVFVSRLPEIRSRRTMLILWVGLSILPFFFVLTYIRYLIGSLVPIALLCASALDSNNQGAIRVHARVAAIVTSLLVLCFAGFTWWFRTSLTEVIIVLGALVIFAAVWWQGSQQFAMAAAAMVLWIAVIGLLYPTLGINAIPARIVKHVEGKPVVLYGDQQPAFLPISIGRSLTVTPVLSRSDLPTETGQPLLIFAMEQDAPSLEDNLKGLGFAFEPVDSYKTLTSRVSWMRFARKGVTGSEWIEAFRSRSLDPVKLTVNLYRVKPEPGPADGVAGK